MTLEERSNLILAFAKLLYVNGQATDRVVAAAERLVAAPVAPSGGEAGCAQRCCLDGAYPWATSSRRSIDPRAAIGTMANSHTRNDRADQTRPEKKR